MKNFAANVVEKIPAAIVKDFVFLQISPATSTTIYEYWVRIR